MLSQPSVISKEQLSELMRGLSARRAAMWLRGKDLVGLEVDGVPLLGLCLRMAKKRMMTKIVMADFESERKPKLSYLAWERGYLLVRTPNLISIGTPKETRQKSRTAAAESAGYRTYLGSSKLHLVEPVCFTDLISDTDNIYIVSIVVLTIIALGVTKCLNQAAGWVYTSVRPTVAPSLIVLIQRNSPMNR